jgi:hypothetical protein
MENIALFYFFIKKKLNREVHEEYFYQLFSQQRKDQLLLSGLAFNNGFGNYKISKKRV